MFLIDKNLMPTPEVKAQPFSADALIAWLEMKPPHEQYNSSSSTDCLLCQFVGGDWGKVSRLLPDRSGFFDNVAHKIPFGRPIFDTTAPDFCTMGAALIRARAYRDGSRP